MADVIWTGALQSALLQSLFVRSHRFALVNRDDDRFCFMMPNTVVTQNFRALIDNNRLDFPGQFVEPYRNSMACSPAVL